MLLTIAETLLHEIVAAASATGDLFGRVVDGGDVVQVLGLSAGSGEHLGTWMRSTTLQTPDQGSAARDGELLLLVAPTPPHKVAGYHRAQTQWQLVTAEVLRLHADYGARTRGLFESDALADACVAVIGLGSGGSVVATQLARCGVGRLRLVDFDRLEVHNIARHVCGLRDIGRSKTRAVRDLLVDISPLVQVQTWETDVLGPDVPLAPIIAGCDLVVAATDSEASKLAINRLCWERGVPVVYGAAYNRAFGGDVFRAVPPDGACYECFHAAVATFFESQPTAAADFGPGYADPRRMADLVAEPGLALDIGVIALLTARMALLTLLHGRATTLPDLPTNWLLFGNRAEWIFQHPLESLFVNVPKRPDCPVCNYDEYVRRHLDMTSEEARGAAHHILADAPPVRQNPAAGASEGEP